MKRTFYLDTGVKPIDTSWQPHHSGTRKIPLAKGQVWRNGTKQIPFVCEGVPPGATFDCACNNPQLEGYENHIVREIFSEGMISKYAYFKPPRTVTSLTIFTEETKELVQLKEEIFKKYLKGKVQGGTNTFKFEIINRLLYQAMNKFMDVYPEHDAHKHIEEMSIEDQEAYVQVYVTDFDRWKFQKEN